MAERKSHLTADEWQAVRAAYEDSAETTREIAARFHISTKTLQNHALAEGWRRRNEKRQVDRSTIITRMFRVLERQIVFMEENMTETGEKEVAVLGKLASTLEKLIDIDKAASPPKPPAQRKDIQELRNKLAQRIAQLKAI